MEYWLDDRAVITVSGPEARDFLQGLVTNDVKGVESQFLRYAALLTPQGKILFDFLIGEFEGGLVLDCPAAMRDGLVRRLSLYRLRSKVEIAARDDLLVTWRANETPSPSYAADPRHAGLGFRSIAAKDGAAPNSGSEIFRNLRLDCGVPEGGDFGQDRMFALDADLDELHGVAFDKGCYVGQELTARMKHRGTARKRLLPIVAAQALAAPGTAITAKDREVGAISSVYGERGFALIRLDKLEETQDAELRAGDIAIRVIKPTWLFS